MEIRNRATGAIVTDSQFRADNPGTSFPKQLTADILDGFGYDPVLNGAAASVRADRDRKLAASDWTVLADSPLTTAKKTEWKTYRTALRDISAAEGFPHTMEWPTEPS